MTIVITNAGLLYAIGGVLFGLALPHILRAAWPIAQHGWVKVSARRAARRAAGEY